VTHRGIRGSRKKVSPQDLAEEPFVLSSRLGTRAGIDHFFASQNIEPTS